MINGDFERGWKGVHHRCVVYPVGGTPYEREAGEIACPEGWTAWYRHGLPVEHDPNNVVGWAAPEVRPCGLQPDPVRVRSGQFGCLVFTFSRIHDAGLFQQVSVVPGTRLKLSAYAHAWSNAWGSPHESDPRWSEGSRVGYNSFFAEAGTPGLDDSERNFTFWLGIDPTGGTNPYAPTVVWGRGAHIYNAYHPVPPVEVTAQGDKVTVFLRSRTLWPFKHNDAYWDDVVLEVVGALPQVSLRAEPDSPEVGQNIRIVAQVNQPIPGAELRVTGPDNAVLPVSAVGPLTWEFVPQKDGVHSVALWVPDVASPLAQMALTVRPRVWGLPREQYARTYVLLHPGAGREWAQAILDSGAWDRYRWTIGGSADDAGIGALLDKRVIAINPDRWPGDLEAFFRQYYPGTRYVPLVAATPEELRQKLASWPNVPPSAPTEEEWVLCQRDPRWANRRMGGVNCNRTIGAIGCYITCLAMAQRLFGIRADATPVTVDEALKAVNGYYQDGCLPLWSAIRQALRIAVTGGDGWPEERIRQHLRSGGLAMARVRLNGAQHFVLVRDAEWTAADPWDGGVFRLYDRYRQPDGYRLLSVVSSAAPTTLPGGPLLTLHLQTAEPGWEEFVRQARPRSLKVMDASLIRRAHEIAPEMQVIFRPYWNDHDQEAIIAGADASRMVARVVGELAAIGLRPEDGRGWLWVEGLNETFGSTSPPERIRRIVSLEAEFARRLADKGLRAVLLNVPVGNVEAEQVGEFLMPVARACSETGGAIGYHAYWWANPQQSGLDSWWRWHAGRALEIWDPIFRRIGYTPVYFFGEVGACASTDGHHLDPGGGWRNAGCYAGNWERYLADLLYFESRLRGWESVNGRRLLGAAIFTSNPGGDWGWNDFRITEAEMLPLAEALRG